MDLVLLFWLNITHSISSSVQLNVNAAATQVERVGNSYSVSGTNIDVTTLGGMSADTDELQVSQMEPTLLLMMQQHGHSLKTSLLEMQSLVVI